VLRTFLTIGVLVSPLGVAACTSTATDPSSALSISASADLALPATMSIVPSARAVPAGKKVAAAAAPSVRATEPPIAPSAFAGADKPAVLVVAPTGPRDVDGLIAKYAVLYDVPVDLVRRVVKRESNFRPTAYNRGHWGLMQIKHATARGMGYEGPPKGLLDADTNLRYAVRYLRGAWLVSGGNQDRAVRFYASGYYYDAKRKGLLDETGLGVDRRRRKAPTI
jgi:soluble lytic murein transglycosylase-like protein